MDDRERFRREDPERTEPHRHWSNLYRSSESFDARDAPGAAESSDGAKQAESWSDVVSEGVRLGYRVIEEQMKQGQRVAEQISDPGYGPAAMSGDVREATERMIRYGGDLVALWIEFVNSTMANGDFIRSLGASWQAAARGVAVPFPADQGMAPTSISVDVCSIRPVRVTLDLKPNAAGRALATHGLRAPEVEKPALTDVTFEAGPDGVLPRLRLRVPEGQPPGLYTGVVVDKRSGELLGTMTAELSE